VIFIAQLLQADDVLIYRDRLIQVTAEQMAIGQRLTRPDTSRDLIAKLKQI